MLYLLESEASEFLHDLGRPLHLLSLKREQRLFSIVKLLEVASTNSQSLRPCYFMQSYHPPSSYVVKNVVVLLDKSLANLLILWIQI